MYVAHGAGQDDVFQTLFHECCDDPAHRIRTRRAWYVAMSGRFADRTLLRVSRVVVLTRCASHCRNKFVAKLSHHGCFESAPVDRENEHSLLEAIWVRGARVRCCVWLLASLPNRLF